MLIINDVHIGHNRQGGTTPASREALRSYLFNSFTRLVHNSDEDHIVILGDLFDNFEIEGRDWVQTYSVLAGWIVAGRLRLLTLVAGNHDHSQKALRVSSFEMLCSVLRQQFPNNVKVVGIDQWAVVEQGQAVIALAHCSNQDIFEQKLNEILGKVVSGDQLLLHCNYDNKFAAVSDHSLNLSREWAHKFVDLGVKLFFAHEHQARKDFKGKVIVFGNQWPTSVSDCLNNDEKFAHILKDGELTMVPTWARDLGDINEGAMAAGALGYGEIDWRELGKWHESGSDPYFIKVVGSASSNEAGECISMIAKFRAKSSAFVITNGVRIEGIAENSDLPESFEVAKAFDVNEFIDSNLDEAQIAAVNKLRSMQS